MKTSYAYKTKEKHAKAVRRDMSVSPKNVREICHWLQGMPLEKGAMMLQKVLVAQVPVPYKRHDQKRGHKPGMAAGRYPMKAAELVLGVLENARSSAKSKGLDDKKLVIKHISAHRSVHRRPGRARAFAKGPFNRSRRATVQVVLEEMK